MKKAFDQTVRDIKREVNKKVMKVPRIEQKILDATSNEPWGPHGSHLADLAQATRNFHEYQMIMNVIWRRINDTGKNWRHVYKALTVLEYIVAHGSERVIDEIREHAYQLTTLSSFQYFDSNGNDQGSNVRRKSQVLIALVNDKEKIQEVRQKALANKDKYRGAFSTGGTYRTGSYGDRNYDNRFPSRDDGYNGYGGKSNWGYGDDDRPGKYIDSYSQDGGCNGRDNCRDDEYNGGRGSADYQVGQGNGISDTDKDLSFENAARSSPQQHEQRLSEKSPGATSTDEEATSDELNKRSDVAAAMPVPEVSSPPAPKSSSPPHQNHGQGSVATNMSVMPLNEVIDQFDEFDPRGSFSAPPIESTFVADFTASSLDPLGSLDLFFVDSSSPVSYSVVPNNSAFAVSFDVPPTTFNITNEASENPFGDSPFKAVPEEAPSSTPQLGFAPPTFVSTAPATVFPGQSSLGSKAEDVPIFGFGDPFGDSFADLTYTPTFLPPDMPAAAQESNGVFDTLFHQTETVTAASSLSHMSLLGPPTLPSSETMAASFLASQMSLIPQPGQVDLPPFQPVPANVQASQMNFLPQAGQPALSAYQVSPPVASPLNSNSLSQAGPFSLRPSHVAASTTSAVPLAKPQLPKEKFETKSSVWADTLSRGLVNLNISGNKADQFVNIGVDFDSINRTNKTKGNISSSTTGPSIAAATSRAIGAAPPPLLSSGFSVGNFAMPPPYSNRMDSNVMPFRD